MKSRRSPLKATVKNPTGRSGDPSPSLEEIRVRAYEIYVKRGRIDGRDLDDWLQAESELVEAVRKGQVA